MPAPDRSHALDNIVVVLFENRSLAGLPQKQGTRLA